MATYTDNYQYTKPTMAESADIRVLNSNFDKVDTIEHATQISLAPAYDPTDEYAAGAVVMFEFLMYQCDEDGATGTFDPTKWHRVTAAEVGAGGTEVEANPAGTPTETLQTLGIAGTIYEIEGGSGGGGLFTDDTLYTDTTGATGAQNIVLSDRLDAYDAIYFEFYFPAEATYLTANPSPLQRVEEAPSGASKKYTFQTYPSYGNRYILLSSDDGGTGATLTTGSWGDNVLPSVYKIHGVKFGGGSAAGAVEATLYEPTTGGFDDIPVDWDWDAYDLYIFRVHDTTIATQEGDTTVLTRSQVQELITSGVSQFFYRSFSDSSTAFAAYIFTANEITADTNVRGLYIQQIIGVKCGGGSGSVEANPAETPTEDLETVAINGTVYNIPGSGSGSFVVSDNIAAGKWTLLASTTGTSSAVEIPAGTTNLVLTAELAGIVSVVAEEGMDVINKAIEVAQLSTWNKGYEYADTAGNHTTIAMSINNNYVTIKSGYNTVTAKVYAVAASLDMPLAPLIYSTEEREVGAWENGKPLYQKTFSGTTGTGASFYLPNTSGIEEVAAVSGYITDGTYSFNIPYRDGSDYCSVGNDANGVRIIVSNYFQNSNFSLTIQYTKTADTPGAGSFGSLGVPLVHYDNTEKIIGTWNGATLYEKTFDVSAVSCTTSDYFGSYSGTIDLAPYIGSFSEAFVDLNMSYLTTSGGVKERFILTQIPANSTNLILFTCASRSNVSAVLTVRYTKPAS